MHFLRPKDKLDVAITGTNLVSQLQGQTWCRVTGGHPPNALLKSSPFRFVCRMVVLSTPVITVVRMDNFLVAHWGVPPQPPPRVHRQYYVETSLHPKMITQREGRFFVETVDCGWLTASAI